MSLFFFSRCSLPNIILARRCFTSNAVKLLRPSPSQSVDAETCAPDLTYQWQEDVENLDDYCKGGYHPTHIGDVHLDGRYEVVHKLGYGTYSTVWLARDAVEAKYVALKIRAADASEKRNESQTLRALRAGLEDHRGRAYVPVPTLLNEFTIDGPNGQHRCIVTEAVNCSVAQSKDASTTWKFPVDVARAIGA